MRQYLYISTAKGLKPGDVEQIVETSKRNNEKRGIGGFLVFNGESFLQVIEGEQASLDELMAVLAKDPRHHGIVRLVDVAALQPSFRTWRMRSFIAADSPSARRFALGTELPASLDPVIRDLALNFAKLN